MKYLFIFREKKTLFDGLGHSFEIKPKLKSTVTWMCKKHCSPHFCRAYILQKGNKYSLRKPHTCKVDTNVSRDHSKIMFSKQHEDGNPRWSARADVVRDIMGVGNIITQQTITTRSGRRTTTPSHLRDYFLGGPR
jgi:hypothetical protein